VGSHTIEFLSLGTAVLKTSTRSPWPSPRRSSRSTTNDAAERPTEAAERRLSAGAFSSGLSVSDFAACLEWGLEPVGLVQGFCAMQQGVYSMMGLSRGLSPYGGSQGGYVQNYQCPHGMIAGEHRMWARTTNKRGSKVRGTKASRVRTRACLKKRLSSARTASWCRRYGEPSDRRQRDRVSHIGTAVKVLDTPAAASTPWSTYLAGQRLAKVFEAGYVPVSIVASVSSIRVWASCVTEYLMEGMGMWSNSTSPTEIEQIVTAMSQARFMVRTSARDQLHGDALHGADLQLSEREFEKGDLEVEAVLRAIAFGATRILTHCRFPNQRYDSRDERTAPDERSRRQSRSTSSRRLTKRKCARRGFDHVGPFDRRGTEPALHWLGARQLVSGLSSFPRRGTVELGSGRDSRRR